MDTNYQCPNCGERELQLVQRYADRDEDTFKCLACTPPDMATTRALGDQFEWSRHELEKLRRREEPSL